MDGSGGLRDVLEVVSLEDDLVLLGLGLGDGDTLEHGDLSDDLLSCKNATQKDEERQRTRARARGEEKKRKKEQTRNEPKKFRMETEFPPSPMMQLMGKWA